MAQKFFNWQFLNGQWVPNTTIDTDDIYLAINQNFSELYAGSGGGSSQLIAPTSSLNVSPANQLLLKSLYAHSRAAKANVAAGVGSMKILYIGDSTTIGAGANGYTAPLTKVKAMEPSVICAQLLNNAGLPARSDSWFGGAWTEQSNTVAYTTFDPRYVPSANWVTAAIANSLGGEMSKNGTDLGVLSFLPFGPVDTFDVYYPMAAGLGSFNLSRTGDATTGTISQSGTAGIVKVTFSGALGNANALKVTPVTTASGVYIVGVDAYNSNIPSIRVCNAGMSGAQASSWVTSTAAYDYLPALEFFAPDLTFIQAGTNDARLGTTIGNAATPGTYLGDLQTLINACKLSGDVIITTHFPSQITVDSLVTQQTYVTALLGLAAANNIAVNDLFGKWQSYEAMSALAGGDAATTFASAPNSYYSGPAGNVLHPSAGGYKSKAQADAAIIMYI